MAVASIFKVNEQELLDSACTLELVHTCSLILDDLPSMDGATLRRGKAANHLVFGEDTAAWLGTPNTWSLRFMTFSASAMTQNQWKSFHSDE